MSAPRIARRIATATGRGGGTRGRARSSCRSRRSARAPTSRAFCSRVSAASRRWCRWCSRPTSAACRRGASTSSSRASGCGSPSARSAGSLGCSTSRSRRFASARWRAATRMCSSTRRSRRSATAAASLASASSSRTPCTRPAGARSSAWTSARPRPKRSGRSFCRSLVARGLVGVQLAISDAHPGLKAAIARVLGSPWQRCTVHFLRDLRGHCRKDQHDALGALIRQLFTAADGAEARRRLADAISQLEPRLPKIARLLDEAEDDVLAFYAFPAEHWPKLRVDQPAGALQPRDRPPHRRRRHLPRRPVRDPPGLDARHRGQRRMARRTQLHQPRLNGDSLRDTDRHISLFQIRTGGRRARRSVSTNVFTDEMSADLLHHVLGLDSKSAGKAGISAANPS